MARIKENQDQEAAKEKVTMDLEECLSKYKAEYQRIALELEECKRILPGKTAAIQREINSLNDRLIDIDKEETNATNDFGHHGNALIQCVTQIRTLAKAINYGATAYTHLVGVLRGELNVLRFSILNLNLIYVSSLIHYSAVRTSVAAQTQLLMSKDPTDIF